jgi:uncharacterized membrane protein YbhN (UPF0104 family)
VQLDKTEIVIRQRSTLELLDLSMRVVRRHGLKIAAACAICGVPLLIANVWVSAWMFSEDAVLAAEQMPEPQVFLRCRHAVHLLVLFLFQFPLISMPATIFLGDQVFYASPTIKQLLSKLAGVWVQSVWVLGISRMALVSLVLAFAVNRNTVFDPVFESLLLAGLAVCLLIRAVWPFAPEILGLERCLIRPTRESPISYAVRRSGLHQSVSSDHVSRFILCTFAAIALAFTLSATALVASVALVGNVDLSIWYDRIVISTVLWLVGLFVVVFRFLSYLDSRIRLEGWELELRLRAEGQRVAAAMNPPSVETQTNPEQVLA